MKERNTRLRSGQGISEHRLTTDLSIKLQRSHSVTYEARSFSASMLRRQSNSVGNLRSVDWVMQISISRT
ncbi:hypothetical protein SERLA73DRAFT_133553 [Serpula lacrymans var. lacrymans S7.3]|uniref:Uncharacterized protein n=2 Tax=Serpula lacrymans var. lacrymans TaxID=341189 RepID=F8PRN9_SERL3|nr:uncharacterized protein SERLADRAFT_384473 [Serpula lacrymans var. lacrymans S7.9]EGO00609.1 hypothetical protein SERLA73DRAFT_133553 [Serpula lacrymans var. lacrymans S7.3]EGO26164.1 hypothetical protein SERLADRAFT_384473 [Serpula lacrymans var. lacrymans S7.9]